MKMQVNQKKKRNNVRFNPITITLESQSEVDRIFALLNFIPLSNALLLGEKWELLNPYISFRYQHWHKKLNALMPNA